jgi:hypothetical protein
MAVVLNKTLKWHLNITNLHLFFQDWYFRAELSHKWMWMWTRTRTWTRTWRYRRLFSRMPINGTTSEGLTVLIEEIRFANLWDENGSTNHEIIVKIILREFFRSSISRRDWQFASLELVQKI